MAGKLARPERLHQFAPLASAQLRPHPTPPAIPRHILNRLHLHIDSRSAWRFAEPASKHLLHTSDTEQGLIHLSSRPTNVGIATCTADSLCSTRRSREIFIPARS
jgi:hypothetical protein